MSTKKKQPLCCKLREVPVIVLQDYRFMRAHETFCERLKIGNFILTTLIPSATSGASSESPKLTKGSTNQYLVTCTVAPSCKLKLSRIRVIDCSPIQLYVPRKDAVHLHSETYPVIKRKPRAT